MDYHIINVCTCASCVDLAEQQQIEIKKANEIALLDMKDQQQAELTHLTEVSELVEQFNTLSEYSRMVVTARMMSAFEISMNLPERFKRCKEHGCGRCSVETCMNPELGYNCPCPVCVGKSIE